MKIDLNSFREFSAEESEIWGKENYGDWLPQLQNQEYMPQTPTEQFFRWYTQGIHYALNRIVRFVGVDNYDYMDSIFTKEMFLDSIAEINKHKLTEDIVVYRYVENTLIKPMLEWGGSCRLKKNAILVDRGYLSTTLSLDAVKNRSYATLNGHSLFTIYVPNGTPCVFVDLISDMNENEMLFAPGIKLKVLGSYWFGKNVECVVLNN